MKRLLASCPIRFMLTGLFVSLALAAAGCGGDADSGGSCTEGSCEFGVCDSASGACVNPDDCSAFVGCTLGYACIDGECTPDPTCQTNGDCAVGVCSDGVCTNPESCSANGDCVDRTFCADAGTCQPDPCNDFNCSRGQCVRGTETCESAPTCTPANQQQTCLAGQKCLDGSCVPEENFCDNLTCDRGVCSYEDGGCADADDCSGDDSLCLDGRFCNAMGECVENLCESNGVECPEGGECVPAVGECQDVSPCTGDGDCIDDHICVVDQAGFQGVCKLQETACGDNTGDGGCPGNQTCERDPNALTTECVEPDECTTSLDCRDQRVCGGHACLQPTTCQEDLLEPNDDAASATDFLARSVGRRLDASLCSGDADVFVIDPSGFLGQSRRGTLQILIDIPSRDVGLGELEATLQNSAGDTLDTGQTGPLGRDGRIKLAKTINAADSQQEYLLRITDPGDVLDAGVSYTVSATMLPADAASACTSPTVLTDGQTLTSDTTQADSYAVGSTCTSLSNEAFDDIFQFNVDQAGEVTLEVTPDEQATDLSVSVLRSCGQIGTEQACADATTEGVETTTTLLEPGTYYAVVQAADGASGGAYSLSLSVDAAQCTPSDSYCAGADTAQICTDGSGFQETSCGLGCNPTTGRCRRPTGDQCRSAVPVDAATSITIDWANLSNSYPVGSTNCVPPADGDTQTDGVDSAYAVEVPANQAMTATLTMADGEQGSLAVFGRCSQPSDSCLTGANAGDSTTETVGWANPGNTARTVYLVADTSAASSLTAATLDIGFDPIVCTPHSTQCNGNQVEQCNALGTGRDPQTTCSFGCSNGGCDSPPNQSCGDAVALTSGQTVSQSIQQYANNHSFQSVFSSCTNKQESGPDAAYKVTTTQPNQVVDLSLSATYNASLYVTQSCVTGQPRCMKGADSSGAAESLSFVAVEVGDYYVYVDTDKANPAGSFELTATVSTPSCTPGQGISCSGSTLTYCDESGQNATATCQGSCSAAACDAPLGDVCHDAIPLSDGDTIMDNLGGANSLELPPYRSGRCAQSFNSFGEDARAIDQENIYRVDLSAGDLLTADVSSSESQLVPFIAESCVAPAQTCQAIDNTGGDSRLQYYADSARTVYVIIDSNDAHTSANYTLSVDITQGSSCAPGSYSCLDAATIQQCSYDGSQVIGQFSCANGCADGACVADPSAVNVCGSAPTLPALNAPNVGSGITVQGSYDELNNDISTSASSCTAQSGAGPDLAYTVTLQPGQVVEASMTAFSSDDPMVYAISDCASPDSTCKTAGNPQEEVNDDRAYLRYATDTAETLHIVGDSEDSGANGLYAFDISVTDAQCSGSQAQCIDGQTRGVCDRGRLDPETCYYGAGCTNGACEPPTNDVCTDAQVISPGFQPTTYQGRMQDFADDLDLSTSNASCTGSGSPGPDAVYSVDLLTGEILKLDWQAPGDEVLWVTDSCTGAASACLSGKDTSGAEHLDFVAPSNGRYYIVADNASTGNPSGVFTLTASVSQPQCTAGDTQCQDADTLLTCDQNGSFQSTSCEYGCAAGACNPPPNDMCGNAQVVTKSSNWQSFTEPDYSQYSSDVDLADGTNSCVAAADTAGPDAFYAVDLDVDDVLQAQWDAPGSAAWVTNTCGGLANACLVGSSAGNPSQVNYLADASGRYYIAADSSNDTASGPTEMRIRTVAKQCDPASYTPMCSGGGIQSCTNYGRYATQPCDAPFGCASGQCAGDTCAAAPNITADAASGSGVTYNGSWDDLSPNNSNTFGCSNVSADDVDGSDAMLAVDLSSGETIHATLESGTQFDFFPTLMIVSDCSTASATCHAGDVASFLGGPDISYTATGAETVYVIAEYGSPGSTANYTLSIDIQ